ncbi:uncharacterized protein LOC131429126 [Malaya genurostris]|uniref:uncharacterized protein LOC131429126 n=1 Tax=Malaya genurostris TaxID=325434 RepID=UPI0026F38392|nr:uncharacterized protein LOC131429126 [Malaya genurostris]
MASLLRVKRKSIDMKVMGVDGTETRVTSSVNVQVHSRSNQSLINMECLVMKKITGTVPSNYINISNWPIPTDLDLADPEFNRPHGVDLLIGIGHFFGLLKTGKVKLANELPYLQETVYGWVVGGLINPTGWQYTIGHCNVAVQQAELSELIERFWESEELPSFSKLSSEEAECEEIFQRTHSRDSTGKYIVRLPFRANVDHLGDSKQHAIQRFSYLEKKFQRQPDLKAAYCAFIDEYVKLGHCRVIGTSEKEDDGFYLPHHAILKPTSSTTKLRTVFDASAKSTSGLSLNDTLMVGATIQPALFDIILRFRIHLFVLTGDISKMYRMVNVHPEHTRFQRILWRTDPKDSLQTLELTTVTYGTAAAPFLATRSLIQLVLDESHAHPLAAGIVKNDFYIDDVLTGAETLEELVAVRKDLDVLLSKGGHTA